MFQNLSIEANAIELDPRLRQLEPEDPLFLLTEGVDQVVGTAFAAYRGFFIPEPQILKGRPNVERWPWFDDYFEDDPDVQEWEFRSIDFRPDELERYIRPISALIGDTRPSRRPAEVPVSYDCVEPYEAKALIQSLAVEILMCADRYAGAALAGNLLLAAEWMQQMYVLMDELTALAHWVGRRGKL